MTTSRSFHDGPREVGGRISDLAAMNYAQDAYDALIALEFGLGDLIDYGDISEDIAASLTKVVTMLSSVEPRLSMILLDLVKACR